MEPARVLVVDDDKAIRLSLCAVLEHHGFQATPAGDVSEALQLISSQK